MSPAPTTINPSQAVERIREIIVGRQLERLEQRVVRLESAQSAAPAGSGSVTDPSHRPWEDRLTTTEARVEALQHAVQRLSDQTREEARSRTYEQKEEIQRLASQIQQVAAMRAAESGEAAVTKLEGRIGSWLGTWQNSLHAHLDSREQRITSQLREEVATLWESTESQITRLQSRSVDRLQMEERFQRIAAAARALAESALPLDKALPAGLSTVFPTPFDSTPPPASGTASPTT
jgi:HPt (histidine-containing phosphotransfer) domain-containing protein